MPSPCSINSHRAATSDRLGGGTIRFDGEVIRKDGIFVTDDLKGLNPDRLG